MLSSTKANSLTIISHRGYLDGPDTTRENKPDAIAECIQHGFDCEIDIRLIEGQLYLGHDDPHTPINTSFLDTNSNRLWIHAKHLDIIPYLATTTYNWFWHETDKVTLTSHGKIWCYPGTYVPNAYTVMIDKTLPKEKEFAAGICTDFPLEIAKLCQK